MAAAGKAPEEWVGQRVVAEIIGARDYHVVARLDGVGDSGVISSGGKPGEPTGDAAFYPWRRIMAMRLARPDDEPPGYGARGAYERVLWLAARCTTARSGSASGVFLPGRWHEGSV